MNKGTIRMSSKEREMNDHTNHHHHKSCFNLDKTIVAAVATTAASSNNKKKEMKRYTLVSFRELPHYMKDNEFILSYYRANWPIKEALFSIFRLHNETLNVWTHLLGFVLFLGLTVANLMEVPHIADLLTKFTWSFPLSAGTNYTKEIFVGTTNLIDLEHITPTSMALTSPAAMRATRWPFFVFLAGSMFCLLSSSICHLFCCHSHHLNLLLLQLDYAGIAVMIITSFFPPIYYIFQCDPHWQFIYLSGITAMGIFTIITLLCPTLSTPKYRSFRALLFASMGLFGIVPAVHALIVNWANPRCSVTAGYELAMAVSYLTGTLFYVTRIPERWKPGWFDLAGHSHQIFHVFVIMGALAHYGAANIFLEYRDQTPVKDSAPITTSPACKPANQIQSHLDKESEEQTCAKNLHLPFSETNGYNCKKISRADLSLTTP